jgi:hypothetical protein
VAHHPVKLNENRLRIDEFASRLIVPGVVVGVLGLAISAGLGFTRGPAEREHFFYSYLLAFVYFLGLTLGALFFTMLHHLARAGWSVVLRRISEGLASNILLMLVLFIPLLFGLDKLYQWTNLDLHKAEKHWDIYKDHYLTTNGFVIRFAIYFAIWIGLALYFKSKSIKQDTTGDVQLSVTMGKVSAPGMIILGYTLSAAAIDLLMSLNANWASTIFGVYIFAGSVLCFLATTTLIALWLRGKGILAEAITTEHYHDLGKLTFAFTFFWGYVAFSQYMLIWYANMPDETQWFTPRQVGPWLWVSLILLFGHLFIPFVGLMSRHAKRRLQIFAFWAFWILAANFIDLFYIIMPNEWVKKTPGGVPVKDLLASRHDVYSLSPKFAAFMDTVSYPLQAIPLVITISCFLGMAGLYVAFTMVNLRGKSIVPLKDPRLQESLAFENV